MEKSIETKYAEALAALREIAKSVGATVGKECSHEFHIMVKEEVAAVMDAMEKRCARSEQTVQQIRDYINQLSKAKR